MTSKDSAVTTRTSDNTAIPEQDFPALEERTQEDHVITKDDDRRDGMEEYAAHYTEPPPAYDQVPDHDVVNRTRDIAPEPGSGESEAPNQRDLREPNGSPTSSSLSGASPKQTTDAKNAQDKEEDTKHRAKSANVVPKKEGSSSAIEEPVCPQDQQIDRKEKSSDSPKAHTSIPIIPSTNIGVAILATLCFNLPLGALAIYFSLMATKAYRDGKKKQGAKKARISIYISLFSIVVTVVIVSAVVFLQAMKSQASRSRYSTKTRIVL